MIHCVSSESGTELATEKNLIDVLKISNILYNQPTNNNRKQNTQLLRHQHSTWLNM